ncbi:hypothetical protein ANCCEY_11335 [Ancylostoma ceylanicum]|uniref:Uncharacterized protein n=1 Tax=Ancylostoma ceylanicum TaxID=53326 RepID=A0A0D6LCF9_9BILA|nr:hypothetical protein ANCCEY_11335 [Ancylostoma ceylanicum]
MVNTMSSYSNSTTGRRRLITKTDAEEKALDRISREAEARMRVKRETREQARQHRYTLLEKRVEEDAEVYRQDAASTSNGLQNCNDGNAKLQEVKLLKRTIEAMNATQKNLKAEIAQRDHLIQENGLVLVEQEADEASQVSVESSGSSISMYVICIHGWGRKPGPLLFSAETIKLVERAVPGSSSLDQKVRKLVDTNKKMRKDYEEMEQSIYSQRISRANHQANLAGHGPTDEVNSSAPKFALVVAFSSLNVRLAKSVCTFPSLPKKTEKKCAEDIRGQHENELPPLAEYLVMRRSIPAWIWTKIVK